MPQHPCPMTRRRSQCKFFFNLGNGEVYELYHCTILHELLWENLHNFHHHLNGLSKSDIYNVLRIHGEIVKLCDVRSLCVSAPRTAKTSDGTQRRNEGRKTPLWCGTLSHTKEPEHTAAVQTDVCGEHVRHVLRSAVRHFTCSALYVCMYVRTYVCMYVCVPVCDCVVLRSVRVSRVSLVTCRRSPFCVGDAECVLSESSPGEHIPALRET